MPDAIVFDRVTLARAEQDRFWACFAGDLGGRWEGDGAALGPGSASLLRFVGGMQIGLLDPGAPGVGAIGPFLANGGPDPHHLRFAVADVPRAAAQAAAAGYQPLGFSLDGQRLPASFLHPRQAAGVVVQLALACGGGDGDPPPAGLAASRVAAPAEVVHVALAVADLDAALALFKGPLGGHTVDAGAGGGLGFVDLAWPGPGPATRLRLLAGATHTGRGGVLTLCLRVADAAAVTGAAARPGWWEVAPTAGLDVRLVLIEPGAPVPVVR